MATGTLNACDYSFAPPNYGQAYAAGVRLFARYLSPSSGKDFTPAEIKTVHGLGAAALPLWEGYAQDALQGYSKGRVDGLAAYGSLTALHQTTGYSPKNKPGVAFAVDFDAQPAQYAALEQYFRGIRAAVAGRILVGVYGSADLVDHLVAAGLADFGFQTYAWSGGRVSPNAHLYQYENGQNFCGGQVDFCQINSLSKLGAWFPPGSRYDTDGSGGRMYTDGEIEKLISDAQYAAYAGGDVGVWKVGQHVWLHKKGDGYNGRLARHFVWFQRLWTRLGNAGVK